MTIILASSSLGRKKLMDSLHIPYQIILPQVDEEKIIGKTPYDTLALRARAKAEEVANRLSKKQAIKKLTQSLSLDSSIARSLDCLIISADSGVILDDKLIGKPKNYQDAKNILTQLSGKTHTFATHLYAIKILNNKSKDKLVIQDKLEKTSVTFRNLKSEEIDFYLTKTDFTKYAGGYALVSAQTFITKVEGSISNVIGLPLELVTSILSK